MCFTCEAGAASSAYNENQAARPNGNDTRGPRMILTKIIFQFDQTRCKSIPKNREYKLNTNLVHTCGTPYLNLSDPTHNT
jgi:hypothetical protein